MSANQGWNLMKIAVLKERGAQETRLAVSPESVKKLVDLGYKVQVESGAGKGAAIADAELKEAGAQIKRGTAAALEKADILLTVGPPDETVLKDVPEGVVLIGQLSPHADPARIEDYKKRGIQAVAMELMPRITRAQSMDVLSSQSNLAGYRAVIEAVHASGKVTPMFMTAAGTVKPAKACIIGAGVAGLQAIATARRLGAVVCAFDVRPAAREQVESLGAKFIEVEADEELEAAGGYAKETSEEYRQRQRALLHETLKDQDIVITTALIPGRPAPEIITEEMVKDMKPGAVLVDLAAAMGGNYKGTEPDKVVVKHEVTVIGYRNLPGFVAADASRLYARNLLHFITAFHDKEAGNLVLNPEDEIIQAVLVTAEAVEKEEPTAAPPPEKKEEKQSAVVEEESAQKDAPEEQEADKGDEDIEEPKS